MDQNLRNELDLIRDTILKTVPTEAIYLFGSYVYGSPNQDSDFDIYVVNPGYCSNSSFRCRHSYSEKSSL